MRNYLLSTIAIGLYLLPAPLARAADDEPKALIEKAIKASGGEEKLAAIKALRIKSKGNVDVLGQTFAFTSNGVHQLAGQLKNEITIDIMGQQLTVLQVYDGKKGWFRLMDNTQELEGDTLKEMQAQAHSIRVNTLVPLLKDKAFTLAPLGEVKVNGKPALGVKVTAKDQRDIDLYFDKETGLVTKVSRQGFDTNTMKEVMHEMIFSDFKDFDGVKHATKIVMNNDGKKLLDLEVTEYKVVDKLDDSEFAKP
jgi:hypothetical protein